MRIALLTSTLEGGGAARVLVNMANHWARAGHAVVLFSFEDGTSPSYYPVDNKVKVVYLDLARISTNLIASLRNNLERLRKIRHAVAAFGPDALISFIDTANIRTLVALIGTGIPVIVSERIHPKYERIGRFWSMLRLATYPLARAVVMQTERSKEYFPGFLQKRLATIPNPVIPPPFLGEAPELPPRTVLAVGRIAPQKGYDVLLDAFAQVSATHPQWRLCIAGGGGPTDSLKSQAKSLGIDDNVRFLGAVRDVGGLLRQAEIYVMSSRYEGFPNALCEAMASGLPCVSSDCPSGPAEIIEHEVNGLLVPNANAEALASALRRLMDDPGLRKRLAAKAAELTASFSENRIMDLWEDLLRRILGRKSAQVGQDKAL